jgi:hypothetical protein
VVSNSGRVSDKGLERKGFFSTLHSPTGRGSVAALVRVFQSASPSQTLIVYSTSQYAIRAFAYGAPGNSERGWQCPNSDLLRLGVAMLQQRTAAIHLRWLLSTSSQLNGHSKSARALALCELHDEKVVVWNTPPIPLNL